MADPTVQYVPVEVSDEEEGEAAEVGFGHGLGGGFHWRREGKMEELQELPHPSVSLTPGMDQVLTPFENHTDRPT